jgi:hypothetical protein
MNAKQRNQNRQTAETLHYAIQRTTGKNHYRLVRFPIGKGAKNAKA